MQQHSYKHFRQLWTAVLAIFVPANPAGVVLAGPIIIFGPLKSLIPGFHDKKKKCNSSNTSLCASNSSSRSNDNLLLLQAQTQSWHTHPLNSTKTNVNGRFVVDMNNTLAVLCRLLETQVPEKRRKRHWEEMIARSGYRVTSCFILCELSKNPKIVAPGLTGFCCRLNSHYLGSRAE